MKSLNITCKITNSSPELIKFFQDTFHEYERDKEKAIRLFFLMRFGMPLKCAEGEKKILHWEDRHDYSEYHYNGVLFAIEDYSKEYYLQSSMSKEDQWEWLWNMPMKEFKLFGKTFKK